MFTLEQILPSAYKLEPRDQVEFVTPGSYSFVVPADVKELSAVAVGAGGGGAQTNDGGGGGGGALQYANSIPVTAGEILTVVVGAPGVNGTNGTNGGYSAIVRGSGYDLYGGNLYDDFEQSSLDTSRYSSTAGVSLAAFGNGSGTSGGFINSGIIGSTKYLAFVNGTMRQVTTLPVNLSDASKIRFRYIYGNSRNGGEQVDGGENLALFFSMSSGTASSNAGYTLQTNIPFNASWTDFEFEIPLQWKVSGVYVRISQINSSGFPFDSIGIDQFIIERKSEILVYAEGGKGAKGPYGGAGGIASGNSAVPIPYDPNGSDLPVVYSGTLDDSFVTVNLPFTINFLGNTYSTVYVSSNGYITFNSGSGSFSFSDTTPSQPHILIYPGDRRLLTLYAGSVNNGEKFVIRQVGRNFSSTLGNIYEIHFYPNTPFFDIFFIRNPGSHSVTPRIGDGKSIYVTYTPSSVSSIRVSTFPPTATVFGGSSGGNGGSGSRAFGGDFLTGGGGGAAGYTAPGGAGGNGQNAAGRASVGGGGGGGDANNTDAIGGGGVGLKGIGNNGRANGGGGSSYSRQGTSAAIAANSQIDFYPVTLSYAWSTFMNTYAVWYDNGSWNRSVFAPVTGTYTITAQVDNRLEILVDGLSVISTRGFGGTPPQFSVFLQEGFRTFTFKITNLGGPAGFAVTIDDPFGNLIWDTRTYRLRGDTNAETTGIGGTNAPSAFRSIGGDTNASSGGFFGGGGGGGDGNAAGRGGKGGVRIIWGSNRSYPYRAGDVIPFSRTPKTGLILHYDASVADSYTGGSQVRDLSGNSNTGVISLGYSPAVPEFVSDNRVLRFPIDVNTKIDFTADELTSSKITVEIWAAVYEFNGGMLFGFNLHDVWTSGGRLGFNTGQGDVYGISSTQVNSLNLTNRWAHYVFVMNAGDYTANKIYIDTNLQTLSQQAGRQAPSLANFNSGVGRIGGWRADNSYKQWMDIAIFKIWNRELTQNEVSATYFDYRNRFVEFTYFTGLYGKRYVGYFNDDVSFFASTAVLETRVVNSIVNFTSSTDQYSWEFKGYFRAPATGTFNFQLYSDDASYLWLGSTAVTGFSTGNALVPHGGLHPPTFSGVYSAFLYSGNYYPIRIQFGENLGQDVLSVFISGPGITGTTNGDGYFFHNTSSRT